MLFPWFSLKIQVSRRHGAYIFYISNGNRETAATLAVVVTPDWVVKSSGEKYE
jgi:hypothetical protein